MRADAMRSRGAPLPRHLALKQRQILMIGEASIAPLMGHLLEYPQFFEFAHECIGSLLAYTKALCD
jgi:hypothetical protein